MGSTELYGTAVPGRMLYPLFYMSVHEHMWMAAGYGMWGMTIYFDHLCFGLGSRAGRVYEVCILQVGRGVVECDFPNAYVLSLLFVRSSEGCYKSNDP